MIGALIVGLPLLWLSRYLWRTGKREREMRQGIRELTSDVGQH